VSDHRKSADRGCWSVPAFSLPRPGGAPGCRATGARPLRRAAGAACDTACRSAWRAGLESAAGPRGSRPPPGPCPSPPRRPKPPAHRSGRSLALFRHPSFRDQLYRL